MADVALGQTGGKPPVLQSATQAYLAMNRRKRMYGGILLLLFIVMLASGWSVSESRNAGDFLPGLSNIFDFPAEVLSEAWTNRANLPGYIVEFFPSLIETINIAAVATLVGALIAAFLSLLASRGISPFPRMIPVFRRTMDALRAVPEIVIALVLIYILGGGPVPAVIAI
ncbi:MAG: PhnE/PtxC family ABC transporter permease, partial [Paracoccaceae bacterium]